MNDTTRDIAALIKNDRDLLRRIEDNPEVNPNNSTVVELKRIIIRRIAGLQSELLADVGSTETELQVTYNCLFSGE